MRGALVAVLALASGCGFSTGGQGSPNDDAGASDASPSGDGAADAVVDQMPDAPTGPQCPILYAPILAIATNNSRYRFIGGGGLSWIDAENDCADDSTNGDLATHLVVLDDAAEATAVIGGILGGLNINDQWIGATDLENEAGDVKYVTDQGTTLALIPTMDAPNKDCIRLKNTGGTEYKSCNDTYKYVCECDGRAADPGRFPNPPDGNGNP
jgi:hypothetical protein